MLKPEVLCLNEVVTRLDEVLGDAKRRAEMIGKGREQAAGYTWAAAASATTALLEGLVRRG